MLSAVLGCSLALTMAAPERPIVQPIWDQVVAISPDCLEPVTVVVLDEVEELWDAEPNTVGGYYWAPTRTVYLERPLIRVIVWHEFAHHLDGSCGWRPGASLVEEFGHPYGREVFAGRFAWRTWRRPPQICRL